MRTLKRLALAAMLAILLVMSLHCIFTSRAYVRAMRYADICSFPLVSEDAPRNLFGEKQYASAYRGVYWGPDGGTTYEYRVTVRHWTSPEETSQTDPHFVVTAAGTNSKAFGHPVPDTPYLLGAAGVTQVQGSYPPNVVSAGGNYSGWIAYDIRWIGRGGWILYAIAAMIGVAIDFRGVMRRAAGVIERGAQAANEGAMGVARIGKVLADKLDEKVDSLEIHERKTG